MNPEKLGKTQKQSENNQESKPEVENFENALIIEGYLNLLQLLQNIDGLKIDTESAFSSLAFFVEELKKKYPDDWKEYLERLMTEIKEVDSKEGVMGVRWFLSQNISSTYIEFLENRKEEVQDDSTKRKLEIIKQMQNDSLDYNGKMHGQGKSVAFGGVSFQYIPEWYIEMYQK